MGNKRGEPARQIILDLLSNDRKNPTSLKTLMLETGMTRRAITDVIRELRKNYPVCSTSYAPGGYWMGNVNDVMDEIVHLNATANTILKTAENLNRILAKMEGRNFEGD